MSVVTKRFLKGKSQENTRILILNFFEGKSQEATKGANLKASGGKSQEDNESGSIFSTKVTISDLKIY